VKIRRVSANNSRKAFEVRTHKGLLCFPYARLQLKPTAKDPLVDVCVDPELGREAFTYRLDSGREGTVHIDHVLEYNEDPATMRNLLLYKLTVEAQKRVDQCGLSKRELIRRMGTSASQYYRILDQTNYRKSLDQVVNLLAVLDCECEIKVRKKKRPQHGLARAAGDRDAQVA
jgi:hypothetical protein